MYFSGAKQFMHAQKWRDFGCFHSRLSNVFFSHNKEGHILWPCSFFSYVLIYGRWHGFCWFANSCNTQGMHDICVVMQRYINRYIMQVLPIPYLSWFLHLHHSVCVCSNHTSSLAASLLSTLVLVFCFLLQCGAGMSYEEFWV